jgi:4-hydroxyacetophenone monooxygenase
VSVARDNPVSRQELLDASDATIDDAVEHADPIVLRGLLYFLTGDEAIAAIPHSSESRGVLGEVTLLSDPDHVALLRAKTAAWLKSYRDAGGGEVPIARERLRRSMELAAGSPIPDAEIEMWTEQLAIDPMARGFDWPEQPDPTKRAEFLVAVIGTGMAGLNAAVHLKRAGIPFVAIEKNGEVGGTWHENRYPGARLDTTSRSYFHSFGVDFPCPAPFSVQAHNGRYMKWVADHFELRDNIVFDTEVTSVVWNETAQMWDIRASGPDGPVGWSAHAVISAVGFLNRPNIPDLPGADSFAGLQVHTAVWPEGLDTSGKRVAVIGSGATGYQLVPELAKRVDHLTLFQREPSWCFEAPGYLSPYPPQVNWLDRNLPYMTNFLRFRSSWLFRPEATLPRVTIDPDFVDEHAVSPLNKVLREVCIAFMKRKLGDRDDLIGKMIPTSPPFSSRPVLVDSNDNIYDALLCDTVELVSTAIERITPTGIRTVDGRDHDVDIIVYATGYRANDYLWPMEVRGRGGATVGKLWAKDGARAYLGVMMPDFPNLFMLYGPNMNSFGTGLGIIEVEELATRFALHCIGGLLLGDHRTVDVTRAAYDRFNAELDAHEARRVYSDSRATSYYKNEHRRSACNCPFDIRLLWNWMRDPVTGARLDPADPDPAVQARFEADLVVG